MTNGTKPVFIENYKGYAIYRKTIDPNPPVFQAFKDEVLQGEFPSLQAARDQIDIWTSVLLTIAAATDGGELSVPIVALDGQPPTPAINTPVAINVASGSHTVSVPSQVTV
jgi:hypothetical protein